MPGVPGSGGPVPKRSDQRRRRNKGREPDEAPAVPTEVPEPDENWHPVALAWYRSLSASGQSVFYEASDWAVAVLLAESMSRELKPRIVSVLEETGEPVWATLPINGSSLSAHLKAMTALLVTEGDRRRAGVELQRASTAPVSDDVPDIGDYRARLAG